MASRFHSLVTAVALAAVVVGGWLPSGLLVLCLAADHHAVEVVGSSPECHPAAGREMASGPASCGDVSAEAVPCVDVALLGTGETARVSEASGGVAEGLTFAGSSWPWVDFLREPREAVSARDVVPGGAFGCQGRVIASTVLRV